MSLPEPMPCLSDEPCPAPLACQFSGSCRHRQIDSAKSYALDCLKDQCRSPLACSGWGYCREWNMQGAREYAEGLAACRARGITDPFHVAAYVRQADCDRHAEEIRAFAEHRGLNPFRKEERG